jgi:hypothetical protein
LLNIAGQATLPKVSKHGETGQEFARQVPLERICAPCELSGSHFERLGSLRQHILAFIAYYNQTAKPIQWSYTVEKLEKKLGAN